MVKTIVAGVVALLAWLGWELLGDLVGEALRYVMRPVTRPLWRAMKRAAWPWPAILIVLIGTASAVMGLRFSVYEGWRGAAGMLLFAGGCGLALVGPFIWRDARNEARRQGRSSQVG